MESSEIVENKLNDLLQALTKTYSTDSGEHVTVTASIGVAISHDASADYDRMYTIADAALYTSKKKGRNCFTIMYATKNSL